MTTTTNIKRILLLAVALLFTGRAGASQSYAGRGLVLKVDKAHLSLTVSCERIPGYMEAMVMPLPVRRAGELEGLEPGITIEFTLVVTKTSSYLESVHIHHYESVEQDPLAARRLKLVAGLADPASAPREVKTGDPVPDFSLIDQNRQNVALSQFNGKVVALTFTYTHCALPNFCFRIANNFRRLQKRFAADLGRNLVFMTVTFDPEHDTPDVMARYGKTWGADPKGWKLLTGTSEQIQDLAGRFGVGYWADEGLMTHSLHTVLINRDGTLAANLEGNEFSADELGDLVETLLASAPANSARDVAR